MTRHTWLIIKASNLPQARVLRRLNHMQDMQTPSSPDSHGLKASQPKSPLLFINTTEKSANGKQNFEAQTLIRSHVMSAFYRKKSSPQIYDEQPPRAVEVGGKTGMFRLESHPQRQKGQRRKEKPANASHIRQTWKKESPDIAMSIPPNLLGSGLIDPFAAAALPWNNKIQGLVRYCRPDLSPPD